MKKLLAFFLLPIAAFGYSYSAGVYTTDGSPADVQAAINAASATQKVALPAGSFTYSSGLTISGKGIILAGAGGGWVKGSSTTSVAIGGSGNKTFTVAAGLGYVVGEAITAVQKSDGASKQMTGTVSSYSGTTLVIAVTSSLGSGTYAQWNFKQDGATIITNNAGSATLLALTEDSTNQVTVRDIHFRSGTGTGSMVTLGGSGKAMVIEDCRFEQVPNGPAVIVLSTPHGIIAKCYFDTEFNWPGGAPWTTANTQQFIRMPSVTETSWTVTTPYGSLDTNGDQNFYVEDCFLHGAFTEAIDIDGGMRFIFRYNVVDNTGLTSHGEDTGNFGLRWVEMYNNTFIFDDMSATHRTAPLAYFFFIRGGTGLFTDNAIPVLSSSDYGGKTDFTLTVENLTRNAGPYPLWGANIAGYQYPAPRQVGVGRVTGTGITGINGYDGDVEPIYQWNNTGGGDFASPGIANYATPTSGQDDVSGYIQVGRDWINGTKPGYTKYTYPHPLRTDLGGDTTPPTPNPSTIASTIVLGTTSFSVTATTSTDAGSPPVLYRFSNDNGSTWTSYQSSPIYTFTGLIAATAYQVKVQAEDSAATPNVTTASSATSVTTDSAVTPTARIRRGSSFN